MPRGPKGEARPTDPIAAAIMTARIATGEITEEDAAAEVASANKRWRRSSPEAIFVGRSTKK